jgi:hypothetical protein
MHDHFVSEPSLVEQQIVRKADPPGRGAAGPFAFHRTDMDLFELHTDFLRPGPDLGLDSVQTGKESENRITGVRL